MKIFREHEARELAFQGAEELYNAVRVTLGPKGRNFIISKPFMSPFLTHDGVTVAKSAQFEGAKEVGASFIRDAAIKNAGEVGDGTTSTTILTYSLLKASKDTLLNPMVLSKQLQEEADQLVAQLKPLEGTDLQAVATLSAASDEIGAVVAEAVKNVGADGSVVLEYGVSSETTVEFVEGFKINSGFVSPYMANDDAGNAKHENIPVLLYEGALSAPESLTGLLEQIAAGPKKLCIVADDFAREITARFVLLAKRGIDIVAIKAPELGQRRIEVMEDIKSVVGGDVQSGEPTMQHLGLAKKLVVDSTSSVFTNKVPEERIAELEKTIATAPNQRSVEFIKERIAGLRGKIAVITIGGASEQETKEKYFRVEDAVAAAKAAALEGVVVGGALSYLNLKPSDTEAGEIFKEALEQPFRQLMVNAGLNDQEKLELVRETGLGIDVMNPDQPQDLVKLGIVDPLAVVKAAIKTSAALTSQLITMGGIILEEKDED